MQFVVRIVLLNWKQLKRKNNLGDKKKRAYRLSFLLLQPLAARDHKMLLFPCGYAIVPHLVEDWQLVTAGRV